MQVSVESPTNLKRRVTVTVPVEQLNEAFDKRIAQLSKTAKVKGFRPGNVPLNHIKQLYGDTVRQESLSDVIQSTLYAALSQENLKPAGIPGIDITASVAGQPLVYVAIFDVLPEVGDVKFDAGTIEKEIAQITQTDVDKVIERLQEQHTKWTEVDRPAQAKDQVVVDFSGSIDGKVFAGGEAHEYPVVIGSNTMIPGFEDGLIGVKKDEKKTIKVTFPETYFAKEVAGKVAEFAITAHKVSAPEVTPLDEDMVKTFGIPTGKLEDLRTEIQKNLERELERVTAAKLKAKIFDLLITQNPLEVPEALVQQESKRIHDEMHPHHGGKEHNHSHAEMAEFDEAAKRNVILGLLVSEFVKQNKIKPERSRIEAHLNKLASAYENPAEVVKWYTSDRKRLAEIEMYILEEQVMDKLLEKSKVVEKQLPYSELVKN
jgi:trigger factor